MNKQEAIELLRDVAKRVFYRTRRRSVHIDEVVELVNQIDEPQKPVVPKFVANWYEENKDNFEYNVQCLCVHNCEPLREIDTWFDSDDTKPVETLVIMHKFGYEIEKEKLYIVEIPNPHSYIGNRSRLARNYKGKVVLEVQDWLNTLESYKLTESEIKEDFDFLWQFAKEVDND